MRSEARVAAFKIIFSSLFEEALSAKEIVLNETQLNDKDELFATELIDAFEKNQSFIENTIKNVLVGYEINRIYKVDLALIYLAAAEIKYIKTPKPVVVNEVLEIAKKFSTENSQKFVNGVLAKIE